MAEFTRVSGDFQQVMNQDASAFTAGTVNATDSALTVNPAGPKLDFITITLANVAANGTIAKQVVDTIQTRATIAVFEFTDTGTDTVAMGFYPTAGWGNATATIDTVALAAAVDAATGGSSSIAASATFTN